MMERPGWHDHLLGLACVIACPVISGVFLALIAFFGAPRAGRTSIAVGAGGFVVNLGAIVVAAVVAYHHSTPRGAIDVATSVRAPYDGRVQGGASSLRNESR